jgi:hypothetical protein
MGENMRFGFIFGILFVFSGCTAEKLKKLEKNDFFLKGQPTYIQGEFCLADPFQIQSDLKFVFMVDISGSNNSSDPGGARFSAISTFVNDILGDLKIGALQDQSIYFTVLPFSSSAPISEAIRFSSINPPEKDPFGRLSGLSVYERLDKLRGFLGTLQNKVDSESTDFEMALRSVADLIQSDLELSRSISLEKKKNENPSTYVLFILSDGIPTREVELGNGFSELRTQPIEPCGSPQRPQPEGCVLNGIKALEELVKPVIPNDPRTQFLDQIVLNSGFYEANRENSAEIEQAKKFMSDLVSIAKNRLAGGRMGLLYGSALDLNDPNNLNARSFDFKRFGFPTRNARFYLKDIFIRNKRLVWYEGRVEYDQDEDGLSDIEESRLGTSATNWDTNNDGVSDFVAIKRFGCFKQTGGECVALDKTNFETTDCNPFTRDPLTGRYPDSDGDGLNDCEETIIGSNAYTFHTNGSWIPDGIQYLFGFQNPLISLEKFMVDLTGEGLSLYQRIKRFLPTLTSSNAEKILPLEYQVEVIGQKEGRNCYRVSTDRISVWTPDDPIEFLVLQGTNTGRKDILMRAEKKTQLGFVTFTEADFKIQGK